MKWKPKERSEVYQCLQNTNAGFELVMAALEQLKKIRGFDSSEIAAFNEQCSEAHASTLSYLTEVIAQAETDSAANLQGRRRAREHRSD